MTGSGLAFAAYALVFSVATIGCIASLRRARAVEDRETRRGLVGLLTFSGGWAAMEVLYLVVPGAGAKYVAYLGSLVVGFATVGAWLYFCSAYTGRSFHRQQSYRRLAVAVYIVVVGVKVTNPLHGYYFSTKLVSEPFVHLAIKHGVFHWVVTGLSYSLVAVGFFMLYELFLEADYGTRPLGVVVGVTAVPAVLDIVGAATPLLLDINHESLGVVAFALGVLYVYDERFLSVQVTGDVDDPVVFLDGDGWIRDFNDHAESVFPELSGSVGAKLNAVLPEAAEAIEGDGGVFERSSGDESRYYLVGDSEFRLGQTDLGQVLMFTDVTASERKRRELERHNDQLEGLAAAIRHELRNTLQIVRGRVDVAGDALDRGDVALARESFETATETADRMEQIVEDLSALAQYGQTIGDTDRVDFGRTAEEALEHATVEGLSLTVENGGRLAAEPSRLRELLGDAFEFAEHNGASTVTVSLLDDGFVVTGDGEPPNGAEPEQFFEYGGTVPHSETGTTLPNLRTLARVHGWSTTVDTGYEGGVRIAVSGAKTDPNGTATD